ncbi:MAG: hypothetical protein ACRD29_17070 [Acidimicrobiales bacterium]
MKLRRAFIGAGIFAALALPVVVLVGVALVRGGGSVVGERTSAEPAGGGVFPGLPDPAGPGAPILTEIDAEGTEVDVTLYHCGVDELVLDGRRWVVIDPRFDETNAPPEFEGHGTFAPSADGDTARYTDDSGLVLEFTAVDDTFEFPPCD